MDIVPGVIDDEVDAGHVPGDYAEQLNDSFEYWREVARETGLEDEGEYEGIDEWLDPNTIDVLPFAARFYDEVLVDHRPSE